VILTEYNEELHIRTEKEISFEEGREKGREAERRKFIRKLLARGMKTEEICALVECSQEEVDTVKNENA